MHGSKICVFNSLFKGIVFLDMGPRRAVDPHVAWPYRISVLHVVLCPCALGCFLFSFSDCTCCLGTGFHACMCGLRFSICLFGCRVHLFIGRGVAGPFSSSYFFTSTSCRITFLRPSLVARDPPGIPVISLGGEEQELNSWTSFIKFKNCNKIYEKLTKFWKSSTSFFKLVTCSQIQDRFKNSWFFAPLNIFTANFLNS